MHFYYKKYVASIMLKDFLWEGQYGNKGNKEIGKKLLEIVNVAF